MVATDQPVCDFVHAHTSPVRGKRRPTATPSRAIVPTFYVRLILDEGEPGKPQPIVRRAQAPPVPSFRIIHCLAGLVRSVILFYPFIYLDFYVLRKSAATQSPACSMHRHSSEPFRWCDDSFCCTTA